MRQLQLPIAEEAEEKIKMTQRKYSLDEIDEMRKNLQSIRAFEFARIYAHGWAGLSISDEQIERELRTLMMNGTNPSELVGRYKRICENNEAKMNLLKENSL